MFVIYFIFLYLFDVQRCARVVLGLISSIRSLALELSIPSFKAGIHRVGCCFLAPRELTTFGMGALTLKNQGIKNNENHENIKHILAYVGDGLI